MLHICVFVTIFKEVEKFSHLVWLEWSDHHITCKIGATQMFLMKGLTGKEWDRDLPHGCCVVQERFAA